MIKKEAVVVAVKDGDLVIDAAKDKTCGCCSNMFCGAKKENHIKLKNSLDLKAGDRVELGLESYVILGLSVLMFLMPSLMFIGGIYGFKAAGPVLSFFLSILGVMIYFIALRFAVINRLKEKLSCRIIRILS